MFSTILRFELRYWLRGMMVWIFFFIVTAMILAATSSDKVTIGGAMQNTHRNAPYVIQIYYAVLSVLTLLMTTAFVANAGTRDFANNTYQILFTQPIQKRDYLLGRFTGATIAALIPMLGVSVGIILAKYMPWTDADRFGSIAWAAHAKSILMFAIPNTLFVSAILFSVAVLMRSTMKAFLGALLLLVAYIGSQAFLGDIKHEVTAAWIDPFGANALGLVTKYFTVSDKNVLSAGFEPLILGNRLLWMSVGFLVLAFAYRRFQFAERSSKKNSKVPVVVAEPAPVAGVAQFLPQAPSAWIQFVASLKTELRGLIRTAVFIVVSLGAFLNCLPSLMFSSTEVYGNKTFPVTYAIVDIIRGSFYMFVIALITFFAGQLVWKERDDRTFEVDDSLPRPEAVSYLAKLCALLTAIFLLLCVTIVAGVAVQTYHHYTRYQMGLYVESMLVQDFSLFVFYSVAAFLFHTLAPNKYFGYFAYIGFLIFDSFGWGAMDVVTKMVNFGSRPEIGYSDFYHFAPMMMGWSWFTLYWSLFSVLVAVVTLLLWRRGKEERWGDRLRVAGLRWRGAVRIVTLVAGVAFFATGAWAFYNTKVLNTILSPDTMRDRRAKYEKTYKKYEGLLQPRITAVKYKIDIEPETRNIVMHGEQTIANKGSQAIDRIHLNFAPFFDTEVNVGEATLETKDEEVNYRIYKLSQPMMPGESRPMSFTVKSKVRGFANQVDQEEFLQNGTFFNNGIAPQIGYQAGEELTDRNERKKRGLAEKDTMPALERNCTEHCMNTYLSNNSDWVPVETSVCTSADQIAIAPGSKLSESTVNGRHCYEYKLDHDSMNFYSFLSARYEVAKEDWNGLAMEVYYHPEHKWNVPKMLKSIRKTFEYATTNFGPYAHKQARIIEFPRVARFAQAFPGSMPYSEGIGFIANLEDPDDIDQVFYIVAHEMGHQWWAHQVIGANMQGATSLSETLAQYTALMVMEKEYGRDMMRKFLSYEMDRYLRSRGRERLKEQPLLKVEAGQGYIHYQKGSVVMYLLKETIGEDKVNAALRSLIEQYAYKNPPYPTSYALYDALKKQTPPEYQGLLKDLFEDITLYGNRTYSAKAAKRADGKYDVTIDCEARKFKADDKGEEKEVPVDDWIEVGAFAEPEKGKKYGRTLYRDRVHMTSGRRTLTFVTAELPEKAGIDPFSLLVDRQPDDNLQRVEK